MQKLCWKLVLAFSPKGTKNPAYGRNWISQPMRIVLPIPKNPASKAKFAKKISYFVRLYNTLYEQKFSNLRPFLAITFPQGFRIFEKFGHWTLKQGASRRSSGVNNWKNTLKTFFAAAILLPLWAKVFKSDIIFFHYFSPRILNI